MSELTEFLRTVRSSSSQAPKPQTIMPQPKMSRELRELVKAADRSQVEIQRSEILCRLQEQHMNHLRELEEEVQGLPIQDEPERRLLEELRQAEKNQRGIISRIRSGREWERSEFNIRMHQIEEQCREERCAAPPRTQETYSEDWLRENDVDFESWRRLFVDINREQAALPEYEASYRRRLESLEREQTARQHARSIARLANAARKGIVVTAPVGQSPVVQALANMQSERLLLPTVSARGHSNIVVVPGLWTEMIRLAGRRVNNNLQASEFTW